MSAALKFGAGASMTIIKFVVGFCIVFILLSIFLGPSQVSSLLAISIICTGGIGLVVWIPLSFAAGSLTFRLLRLTKWYRNKYGVMQQPKVKIQAMAISNDQRALTDYIQKVRATGQNDAQASAALKAAGWREETISDALKALNG